MKLKRKKIGDRNYNLVDTATGQVIANVVMTGEYSRDDYPWDWHLTDGKIFGRLNASTGSSAESLGSVVDSVESEATSSGLLKPAGYVSPWDIKAGQVFRYQNYYFRATQDAYGEFNATIPANSYRGELTEVRVGGTDQVTLYVEA